MKKAVILNVNKLNNVKISFDYKKIILFTILICGTIFGCILLKNTETGLFALIQKTLINHLSVLKEGNFINLFSNFITIPFLFVFVTYLLGLNGGGTVFISLPILVLGIVSGIVFSTMISKYMMQGLIFCLIIYLPLYSITAATIIKCCCESYIVSKEIFQFLINGKSTLNNKSILKEYTLKYLVFLIPICVASIISTSAFLLSKGLFNFF